MDNAIIELMAGNFGAGDVIGGLVKAKGNSWQSACCKVLAL